MSSCLCKNPEGAVFPFRFLIQAIEDGIDDPVDAGHIDKADHGSRAPADLHEAALDDVGGTQLRQSCGGKSKQVSSSGKSFSNCFTIDA